MRPDYSRPFQKVIIHIVTTYCHYSLLSTLTCARNSVRTVYDNNLQQTFYLTQLLLMLEFRYSSV